MARNAEKPVLSVPCAGGEAVVAGTRYTTEGFVTWKGRLCLAVAVARQGGVDVDGPWFAHACRVHVPHSGVGPGIMAHRLAREAEAAIQAGEAVDRAP